MFVDVDYFYRFDYCSCICLVFYLGLLFDWLVIEVCVGLYIGFVACVCGC